MKNKIRYSNIYLLAIRNPKRVLKFYILWGVTSVFFSCIAFLAIGWLGALLGIVIGLISNREYCYAAMTTDKEALKVLKE